MNIAKVKNSAAIVNYTKPGLEMVEMETEGGLLLTASGPDGRIATQGFGKGGASALQNGGTVTATRRND
jgi:hypothetical protein